MWFYIIDDSTYYSSGTYNNIYTNTVGCDSLSIVNLTINNSQSVNISFSSCDSYNWNGNLITTGLYIDTLGANNCDA